MIQICIRRVTVCFLGLISFFVVDVTTACQHLFCAATGKKMLEADPDFAMGNIFTLGIEAMGRSIKECWRLTHMGNIFTLGIEAMGRFIIECWRLTHMGNIFTLGIEAMGRFILEFSKVHFMFQVRIPT